MNINYMEHLNNAKNRFGEMMDMVFEGNKIGECDTETMSFRNGLYNAEEDEDEDVEYKVEANDKDDKNNEDVLERKLADAPTWNTQFIVNKIFDNLIVFKSLTLTFNKNELDEVLNCLKIHSTLLENLEFSLNINSMDECEVTFKRR